MEMRNEGQRANEKEADRRGRYYFQDKSYAGLGVNKVAVAAGVSKKLIYRYFGSFDNLVETYVLETDCWMRIGSQMPHANMDLQGFVGKLLKNQFTYFLSDPEMQQLILWELSTDSDLMKSIHRTRKSIGQLMLELVDERFEDKPVNFRAVAALLVGGIYYTVLHTRYNGGIFTGLDLSLDKGQQDMLEAIDFLINIAFAQR